jgi:thiol-disulfide isomerase/thioredoxin
MSQEINIVLARANWCGHCQHFEPIFEHSKNIYKNNDELKKLNIEFKDFDLAEDNGKNSFMLSHFNAMDKVEGYPTVLVNVRTKNNNKYLIVPHTVIDEKINKKDQTEEAAKRFLQNISNALKSESSENKVLYVQNGGGNLNYQTSLEEEKYRKKYLKYKSKYLRLKV